ncbi:glycosyltransferase [Methanobrevibacter sp.]|uniref:glycosyltransferase n=1 Tax=Methanobrevibacter sp. TaxID=66852 RepID=UPI0025E92A1F|nr:glycosyltransferase [Methanobrevibacter sp.]MBQ6511317.1 glycosyltransferase [Methanobrevibacter sp.]
MKILVVQESDWIERNPHQQHHLMERMAIRGHEIRVIDYPIDWPNNDEGGLIYKREVHKDISKIKENANIEVIRPSFVKIKGLNYATLFFSHKKEIERQVEEFNPDIILGLGILNTYNASKIAKKHNIPFVYYFIDVLHALIPEKAFQGIGKWFTKKTIENADLVITINKKLSEFAINMGSKEESTILIDAGIDLDSYDPDLDGSAIRRQYGIGENDIVLFFMGWIYEFAGMTELALALGKSREKYPNYRILVVGDGDAYDEMCCIRDEYGMESQLIMTGKQPFARIPEFLAAADFCLLPAHIDEPIMQDIVPIKIYEYLAMGNVVIATELPGISKEFGYGHGIEYIQEASQVLETVKRILDEGKYDEIAGIGREYVKGNDWEAITDKFEKAMEDLL